MAFRPLTEADCGQPNPLTRLASHITHDHTFSDNHGQVFQSSSDQLVEQFLQETRAIPQTYRMDDLMREMHEIESQRSALPPVPASTVKDHLTDDSWALQYIEDGKTFHEVPNNEAIWAEIASQEQHQRNLGAIADSWSTEILNAHPSTSDVYAINDLEGATSDSRFVYSKFMRFMKNEDNGDVNLQEGKLTEQEAKAWENEYFKSEEKEADQEVKTWEDEYLKTEGKETVEDLAEKWAEESKSLLHDAGFNENIWDKLLEEHKYGTSEDGTPTSWVDEFNKYYNSPQKEYEFTEDNPMSNISNPLEKGKQFLEEGDLPSAVLCFEAAAQQQPENVEAWMLLGTTHAENEQDPMAIIALNKCLQLDPSNLTAFMALAVSYTNENYYNQACTMLYNWLKHNPKYADMVPETDPEMLYGQVTSLLVETRSKLVENLYIKAAQRNPNDIDCEIQCGLGVLFNLNGEYDKAADCFRAALSVKQDDAKIWNRLGATLANGSKAEEAVDAYHHALNLAPGFIRARYNVGVTCINLHAYKEAAEHLITALNQQARGKDILNSGRKSQMSDTIWSTLRMCVSLMNRGDLKPFVDNQDLPELNKAFGID